MNIYKYKYRGKPPVPTTSLSSLHRIACRCVARLLSLFLRDNTRLGL